jgi:hypothetical protein
MVPRTEEPPLVPLTAQVTLEFEVPETVAVNWKESPAGMLAEEGETDTETAPVPGVVGAGELPEGFDTVAEQLVSSNTADSQISLGECITLRTHLGTVSDCDDFRIVAGGRLLDEREEEGQGPGRMKRVECRDL